MGIIKTTLDKMSYKTGGLSDYFVFLFVGLIILGIIAGFSNYEQKKGYEQGYEQGYEDGYYAAISE